MERTKNAPTRPGPPQQASGIDREVHGQEPTAITPPQTEKPRPITKLEKMVAEQQTREAAEQKPMEKIPGELACPAATTWATRGPNRLDSPNGAVEDGLRSTGSDTGLVFLPVKVQQPEGLCYSGVSGVRRCRLIPVSRGLTSGSPGRSKIAQRCRLSTWREVKKIPLKSVASYRYAETL